MPLPPPPPPHPYRVARISSGLRWVGVGNTEYVCGIAIGIITFNFIHILVPLLLNC